MREYPAAFQEKFWSRVTKLADGCWIYGKGARIWHKRVRISGQEAKGAHRIAWELTRGSIPNGACVCHHCDIPACVNPDHLFLGTQRDNVRDCYAKGRDNTAHGERHYKAKLTAEQVIEIRRRYKVGIATQPQLAEEFGVGRSQICHIVHRNCWKHVE